MASTETLRKTDAEIIKSHIPVDLQKSHNTKFQWNWLKIVLMVSLHLSALYGLYLVLTSTKWFTIIFTFLMYQISTLGITAGVHRLWSHKSYKAKWPLTLLLAIFNTTAFQYNAIHWAKYHRSHHKYVDTDADPYNASRGFWFSHVGWLLCSKHPEVEIKGEGIDVSDLYADPILRFQRKYFPILMTLLAYAMPTWIPIYFWGESAKNALFANLLRLALCLNAIWSVNSIAHMFGSKPYDRFIKATQNRTVAILAMGEGWHNYHHTFPWDYRTAELGNYGFNLTSLFIDMMAKIGWAYDLKTVSEEMIMKRVERTGHESQALWGWGDVDQSEEEKRNTVVINRATEKIR